jgi:hypothetical protein
MTPDQQTELGELIHAVCEDRQSDAESGRLEVLLRGDAAAQAFYLKHVHLHGCLRWDLGQAVEHDAVKAMKERFGPPSSPVTPVLARSGHDPRRLGWLAAAVLLLSLGGFWMWSMRVAEPPGESFAVLSQTVDAAWEAGAPAPPLGGRLGQGTLRLKAGLAQIDYDDGTRVTLEGPAEIDLVAVDRARLRHGQVMARVPAQSAGFSLETPAWQVDKPDTTYGVAVEPDGAAELCVFQGQVEVTPARQKAKRQRLAEGKAARLDPDQTQPRPLDFDATRYARSWPVSFGVLHTDGVVRFVPPGPLVLPRRHQNDESLIVFPERERVTMPKDIVVTITAPGRQEGPFEGLAVTLPAGTQVRSYLLQFNPLGAAKTPVHRLVGSITFDRPVVGLIATSAQLAATDTILGAEGALADSRSRGIELGDRLELSPDRRTLRLDWTAAAGIDQLRVLVAADASTSLR